MRLLWLDGDSLLTRNDVYLEQFAQFWRILAESLVWIESFPQLDGYYLVVALFHVKQAIASMD
jgi:hypothetical protein